jgi:hypothetical protein
VRDRRRFAIGMGKADADENTIVESGRVNTVQRIELNHLITTNHTN